MTTIGSPLRRFSRKEKENILGENRTANLHYTLQQIKKKSPSGIFTTQDMLLDVVQDILHNMLLKFCLNKLSQLYYPNVKN